MYVGGGGGGVGSSVRLTGGGGRGIIAKYSITGSVETVQRIFLPLTAVDLCLHWGRGSSRHCSGNPQTPVNMLNYALIRAWITKKKRKTAVLGSYMAVIFYTIDDCDE